MKPPIHQIAAAFKKYFSRNPLAKMLKLDRTLKVSEDGTLGLNTTEDVTEGNPLPVTSNAVHKTIGSTDELLEET